MLNNRPIFISAFARGGSNIIMNILMSHSDVCINKAHSQRLLYKSIRIATCLIKGVTISLPVGNE